MLLAAFVLGAGAYLSTYPVDVIRAVGIALMAAGLWGLIIWFLWERRPKMIPSVLLFGGITFAALAVGSLSAWYFWSNSETLQEQNERRAPAVRHLNADQRRKLHEAFRLIGRDPVNNMGVALATAKGNDECMKYAKDFYDALIGAGIDAGSPQEYSLPLFDPDQTGVTIGVADAANPPEYAQKIQRALQQASIPAKWIKSSPMLSRSVIIFIAPPSYD